MRALSGSVPTEDGRFRCEDGGRKTEEAIFGAGRKGRYLRKKEGRKEKLKLVGTLGEFRQRGRNVSCKRVDETHSRWENRSDV